MERNAALVLYDARALLGEGPAWDRRCDALFFVDIKGRQLHRLTPHDGAHAQWAFDEPIGWIVPRAHAPGYVAGFKSGFKYLTLDPFELVHIGAPEPDRPGNRLNDAKADAAGRIWAGSMDDAEREIAGALYRLDPNGAWRRMDDGYRVANGPAFSPDGAWLYHTDSARRVVYRFALTPEGELRDKTVFVRFADAWGYPDGMSTDVEGGIWIAHWDGARISRFTPDGALDRSIALPVSRPTSCVFFGEGLRRMAVTSASIGCAHEAHAGALFEVDPGIAGAPAHAFGG